MPHDLDRARAALQEFAEGLAADGYGLDVVAAGPTIAVVITAGPAACEECLVPKAMMRTLLLSALEEHGVVLAGELAVTYPPGHHEN